METTSSAKKEREAERLEGMARAAAIPAQAAQLRHEARKARERAAHLRDRGR